jgi:hypothetical protein
MHIIILFIHLFIPVNFQETLDRKEFSSHICSYYGEKMEKNITLFSSESEAQNVIGKIVGTIGLHQNFEIRSADIPNAAAVIYGTKRYILYNPEFIKKIDKTSGTNWAGISILAHEIGHHLNGHTLTSSGSRPDIELEADEFSGFILRRLGSTLEEAQSAMRIASGVKSSHTHPARADRLIAIATGWKNAGSGTAKDTEIRNKIEKPVLKPSAKNQKEILAENYIAYDVKFFSDPNGLYYVTIRNNLVKIINSTIYIAGRLTISNKKNYTLMFYDKEFNYLYINRKGDVINKLGKKVGTIKKRA